MTFLWLAGLAWLTYFAPTAKHSSETASTFVAAASSCPVESKHCFGISAHIVEAEGQSVQTPAWFASHVEQANLLFAPIGVGFEVIEADMLDASAADIDDRGERDRLGRTQFTRGVIHVFLVRRLADVDIAGEVIRGVHWRDRADRDRRWIILSSIASSRVLAHELGHFFGLRHATDQRSIMNKEPGEIPWSERMFIDTEYRRMKARTRAMLESGALVERPKSDDEALKRR